MADPFSLKKALANHKPPSYFFSCPNHIFRIIIMRNHARKEKMGI